MSNNWASMREKVTLLYANNKGADQPSHRRSLISTFVICFLESLIVSLATCEITIFKLVSINEQTGLSLMLSETLKIGFNAFIKSHILIYWFDLWFVSLNER